MRRKDLLYSTYVKHITDFGNGSRALTPVTSSKTVKVLIAGTSHLIAN